MANGFKFGGVHSDAFELIVNAVRIPLTPPVENRLQEVAGFDGAWDYGVSYAPKPIEVDCTILANSSSDLKVKARKLAGLLNPRRGILPLIFDDDPSVMYYARIENQIPLERLGAMGTFTLQFICPDPFTYAVELRSGMFSTTMKLVHHGTHVSRPKMTVTHNGGSGKITNKRPDGVTETMTFTSESPAGTYEINCKESTITKDGKAAYNYVKGDFFSFGEGTNVLSNSGGVSQTALEFRDTWL